MVLTVDLASMPATLSLRDPGDFATLEVSVVGGDGDDSLVSAVSSLGRVSEDGRHAFIDISALQTLAGTLAHDESWGASLRGMVEAAGARGWVTADGALEAPVEWI